MASLLSKASSVRTKRPHKIVLYGPDGCGKTFWASKAPNPIFIGNEDGASRYGATETPVAKSVSDIKDTIKELIDKKGAGFETLVIDAVDGIESLCENHVVAINKWKSIEDAGYGRGYKIAEEEFANFVDLCDTARDVGMNIILIGHSHVKTVNDPAMPAPYDRHQLKLREKSAARIREWSDAVFFATYEVFVKTDGSRKGRAFGEGKRVMYTERRPAFDAKNREGLPFCMDLSWDAYINALNRPGPEVAKSLREEAMAIIPEGHELSEVMHQSINEAGDNVERLKEILNRIKQRLE